MTRKISKTSCGRAPEADGAGNLCCESVLPGEGSLVCCGDFYIEPLEIQIEFSKANNATDWLAGLLFRHTERIRSIDGTLFVLTCISRPDAISPAFS